MTNNIPKNFKFSSKLLLEWRPGSFEEFPDGVKDELDDIIMFDARWKAFYRVFRHYQEKEDYLVDVDEIVVAMKKQGYSAYATMMFLKRLRRLNLVRFTFDDEALMGKLEKISWLLN